MYAHTCTHNTTHLIHSRRSHSDDQATAPDGRDHFTCWVTAQNQSTGAHVFLHGTPEGVLSILSQTINLRQQDNYKIEW